MNQTISQILWLMGLVFISMPLLFLFRSRISKLWFWRTFWTLFIVFAALTFIGQFYLLADRMQNNIQHPGVWGSLVLISLFLLTIAILIIWVYWTTRDWGCALEVCNKLEWPVKDKNLLSKLSKRQIDFLKVTALFRLLLFVILGTVVAVKVILLFRF
jgi:hypothetical protein